MKTVAVRWIHGFRFADGDSGNNAMAVGRGTTGVLTQRGDSAERVAAIKAIGAIVSAADAMMLAERAAKARGRSRRRRGMSRRCDGIGGHVRRQGVE